VACSGTDLLKGASGRRGLAKTIVAPTGERTVTLDPTGVIPRRANHVEGAAGDVVELPKTVASPTHQRPIIRNAARVGFSCTDLAKGATGDVVELPKTVVSPTRQRPITLNATGV